MELDWKSITPLPDRQYQIRVDRTGRITLRNRCFLKKCELKAVSTPIPSATPGPILQAIPNYCTPIPVMAHALQLNPPPDKPDIHHHAFDRREFLELYLGYYNKADQNKRRVQPSYNTAYTWCGEERCRSHKSNVQKKATRKSLSVSTAPAAKQRRKWAITQNGAGNISSKPLYTN